MKKNIIAIIIGIFIILSTMFIEYRYIMENLCPYLGESNTVYIEIFNQVDEYTADNAENLYGG